MKVSLLWAAGVVAMIVMGYWSAFHAQDLIWLLIPGLAILIALVFIGKIFR